MMIMQNADLWAEFRKECPWISKISFFRHWAFGHYVRAYQEEKRRSHP